MTGMSLTTQQDLFYALPPWTSTTTGTTPGLQQELIPNDEDGYITLVPGEGLCLWQADAGTAADTRKVMINIGWEEYDR